ncbi:MAG: FecR domain-containing protein [Leptonema sp. (in: bacteria)]
MTKWKITLWIPLLVVFGFLTLCKEEKAPTKTKNSMIITFVSGDVKIIRKEDSGATQEIPAKLGMLVYSSDIIKTEKGKVDLQAKTGSSIRIKEMTTLSIQSLASESGGESNLNLDHGNMIANVKKATKKEEFKVTTPTAIAGVRGTIFAVEVDPFEKTSSVKVLEGKVSLKPRIIALENTSKEDLEKKPELQSIKKLEEKEVILEEKQEGKLNPEIEKKIVQINEKLEDTKTIQEVSKELEKKEQSIIIVEKKEPSAELLIDKETMVTLKEEEYKQVEEGKNIDTIFPKKLEEKKINEEKILKMIEENANKKTLNSEKEIKQYYNKLEIVNLKNGKKITGAVIGQTEEILIIHTTKGIVKINKNDVESQEFR